MKFYFCEIRADWYLGNGHEIESIPELTLERWAKQYPPRSEGTRKYFATDSDHLALAKGNTAREEMRRMREQRRNAFCRCYWS